MEDDVYILNGNNWENVSGSLKHVSAGESGVWGVNSSNHILYRYGVTPSNPAGTLWKTVPGKKKVGNKILFEIHFVKNQEHTTFKLTYNFCLA